LFRFVMNLLGISYFPQIQKKSIKFGEMLNFVSRHPIFLVLMILFASYQSTSYAVIFASMP
jgi:hypothetical protein